MRYKRWIEKVHEAKKILMVRMNMPVKVEFFMKKLGEPRDVTLQIIRMTKKLVEQVETFLVCSILEEDGPRIDSVIMVTGTKKKKFEKYAAMEDMKRKTRAAGYLRTYCRGAERGQEIGLLERPPENNVLRLLEDTGGR